jgi:hypothetical protein
VITLPVLPLDVTATATEIVAGTLERWKGLPDETALRGLVRELRNCIFESTVGTEDDREWARRVGLSLDLCLFAPRKKKGR